MMRNLTPWPAFFDVWARNTVITLCIGGVIQLAYETSVWWWPRQPSTAFASTFKHFVLFFGGAMLGCELACQAIAAGWNFPIEVVRPGVFRLGILVGAAVTGVVLLVNHLSEQLNAAELREAHTRRVAMAAQLQALQARTKPHFLFNSLNTVAALIEEEPDRAVQVLEHLSGVYRFVVDVGDQRWVRLEEELGAVEDYLQVEEARFPDRLTWTLRSSPELRDVKVPPFVVQPLVENAVKHGIGSRRGPGWVKVTVSMQATVLCLRVEDDGVGLGNSQHTGSGTALTELKDRLLLLYGSKASLAAEPRPQGGTRVEVRISEP